MPILRILIKVDYVKPAGTPVMRTVADYRQLNDALFHAGNNSGSLYEWEDVPKQITLFILLMFRKMKKGSFHTK